MVRSEAWSYIECISLKVRSYPTKEDSLYMTAEAHWCKATCKCYTLFSRICTQVHPNLSPGEEQSGEKTHLPLAQAPKGKTDD